MFLPFKGLEHPWNIRRPGVWPDNRRRALSGTRTELCNQLKKNDMAFLKDITFTGSLGDFSAYKMKGSDKIILRRKGGPKKETVNNAKAYALNRLHRQEFGGSATLGKYVRFMLGANRTVSNYNITARLNSILKHVKRQDTEGELGKRALRLSAVPSLLQGFPLNKQNTFDTIMPPTVRWSIARETRSAHIELPELIRGTNFNPSNQQPFFCITAVLGIIPDILYSETRAAYGPPEWFDGMYTPVSASSPWYPAKSGAPPIMLEVSANMTPPDDSYTLVLSIAVRFGALYANDKVELLDYMGAAKILGAM